MKAHGVAALLALVAAQAGAADKAKPAGADDEKPRLVCFSERATGSHLRKRICMTEEQMAERRKRDQETMARMKGKPKALDSSSR